MANPEWDNYDPARASIRQRMEALGFDKPDVDDNVRDMLTMLESQQVDALSIDAICKMPPPQQVLANLTGTPVEFDGRQYLPQMAAGELPAHRDPLCATECQYAADVQAGGHCAPRCMYLSMPPRTL